jgi:predicted HicB family RNase H-like nuclease
MGQSETLNARVPIDVVRAVRAQARAEGVSVSVMVHRMLVTAIHGAHATNRPTHAELISTLFD